MFVLRRLIALFHACLAGFGEILVAASFVFSVGDEGKLR